MPLKKFDQEQIGEFKTFLSLKWSISMIVKHFSKSNVFVSEQYLYKLRNEMKKSLNNEQTGAKSGQKIGRPLKLIQKSHQLKELEKFVKRSDPPTQEWLANKFKVSRSAISYIIRKVLNKKLVKKPIVHKLTKLAIEKRYRRSWSLYRRLRENRWKKFLTSD